MLTIATFLPCVCALGVKLAVVTLTAGRLRQLARNDLSAWISAWITVQASIVGYFIILSLFNAVSEIAVWGGLAVGLAGLGRGKYLNLFEEVIRILKEVKQAGSACCFFLVFFGFFCCRAAIFQDFSYDAQTYGLVREALWMNYGSVLLHMDSPQLNVFVNEWNGELLALFYGLVAGNIQGFMFGNVEVLLLTFLSVAWLSRQFGASGNRPYWIAGICAVTPACVSLAGTVKGDLLSCVGLILSGGWLTQLRTENRLLATPMMLACLSLSVGSKVTAAYAVLMTAVVAAILVPKDWRSVRYVPFGLLAAGLLSSRYAYNLLLYGNPFQRMERPAPGLETLYGTLAYIAEQSFAFSYHTPGGPQSGYLLAAGAGLTGYFVLISLFVQWSIGGRPSYWRLAAIGTNVLALVAIAYVVPAHPWAFRYFLPSWLVIVVAALSFSSGFAYRPANLLFALFASSCYAVNGTYVFWSGEINANRAFLPALADLNSSETYLDRALLAHPLISQAFRSGNISNFDRSEPLTFVVYQEVNAPVLPVVGSHAQNRLTFVGTPPGQAWTTATAISADFVVFAKPQSPPGTYVVPEGFRTLTNNEFVLIAEPERKH